MAGPSGGRLELRRTWSWGPGALTRRPGRPLARLLPVRWVRVGAGASVGRFRTSLTAVLVCAGLLAGAAGAHAAARRYQRARVVGGQPVPAGMFPQLALIQDEVSPPQRRNLHARRSVHGHRRGQRDHADALAQPTLRGLSGPADPLERSELRAAMVDRSASASRPLDKAPVPDVGCPVMERRTLPIPTIAVAGHGTWSGKVRRAPVPRAAAGLQRHLAGARGGVLR